MTHLGVEFYRLWNVADHLRVGELLLRLPVFRDLEDADLACPSRGQSHKLREVVCKIMHHACLRQEERVGALFFVVDARPDHLEAALRLQLHDADVELLVEDDGSGGGGIAWRDDF